MTEIDTFLDDLDRLAATAAPREPAAFYRQLLPAASMALGADAAEYVALVGGGTPSRWAANGRPAAALIDGESSERLRLDAVPRILSGGDGAPLVAAPVEGAGGVVGVLAFQLGEAAANPERCVEVAAGVAEAAGRYELRREADRVAAAELRLARVESLLVRLHARRGQKAIAREAAEQGRLLSGCDRLSVLARSGADWRIVAVSGVTQVSRRSDAARDIEGLVRASMRWGGPVLAPSPGGGEPTPLSDELDRYRDSAGVRALRVLPCRAPAERDEETKPPRVALLAEWFDEALDPEADAMLAALARHVGVAIGRDAGAGWGRWSLGRAALALLLLSLLTAGAVLSLVLPATLWLTVEGRFTPLDQSRVFAPLDGVVREVLVSQAESVAAGQALVRLESADLRLKQEEVAEAIAASEAEIAALETEKLRASLPGRKDDAMDATTLASRVAALRERLGHQQRRKALLEEQAETLLVTSPIAGSVVSWRPEDYLADRPVRRGQRLLEVVADGRWRIELDAPDHRVGPLLRAQAAGEPLLVQYVVRSDPAATHAGTVAAIAETTHADEQGSPVVRVVVDPTDAAAANPRSGLGVSAKIDCGESSLAYVWLHEAIESIRRYWF